MKKILLTLAILIALVLQGNSQIAMPSLKGLSTGIGGGTGANAYDDLKDTRPDLVQGVSSGKLTGGIDIVFEDGTRIQGGQTFTPQFFTSGWKNPGNGFASMYSQSKGRKVTINYKGTKYYGILEFNNVYKGCNTDPAARSYAINIGESAFSSASGGNISVQYEYYDCSAGYTEEVTSKKGKKKLKKKKVGPGKYTTWVLWLSDVPFN
jgi:hypothetical protein